MGDLIDELQAKVKVLSEELWERQAQREHVEPWLANFGADAPEQASERTHALFLLSQFMYFGRREVRELLLSLYRDLFRYPILADIRRANGNTRDLALLGAKFDEELLKTRFFGVGNPSESGQHLLYYFRQENELPKNLFINTHEVFSRNAAGQRELRYGDVKRYVFIDDFCGSGTQAEEYSRNVLEELKAAKPDAEALYYSLFATTKGRAFVESNTKFDSVRAVFELDESYKVFGDESRYFAVVPQEINKPFGEEMCRRYGDLLYPGNPLGFKDSQLLIGFMHNVPDNSLPIIWSDPSGHRWTPIFRRYPKIEW